MLSFLKDSVSISIHVVQNNASSFRQETRLGEGRG